MLRNITLILLATSSIVLAQDGRPSTREALVPFMDEHTMFVARVDMSRVDVEAFLKLAASLGEHDAVSEASPAIRAWVQNFVKHGGRDILMAYGPSDYPQPPCLIIPAPLAADARKEMGKLAETMFEEFKGGAGLDFLHGCVVVGRKKALETLKARKPVDRRELLAAMDAGKDAPIQIAFAFSEEAKKIHEQVAPMLPAELGGGSIQKLTRGLRWATLTIESGPKMTARLLTEASSAEAAQDLQAIASAAAKAETLELVKKALGGEEPAGLLKNLFTKQTQVIDRNRLITTWELGTNILAGAKKLEAPPVQRVRSANNLKQLMLALHNYHDTLERFPANITSKGDKPLLSWRVAILPYIDQEQLYRQFKLDQPWDSEHNRKLAAKMPKVFKSPNQADTLTDHTTYLGPLGQGFFWDSPKGTQIRDVTDGLSNTVTILEVDDGRAVVWTKPDDFTVDLKNPLAGLLGHYTDGFHAAFADGSVRFVSKKITASTFKALLTRGAGDIAEFPK